MFVAAGNKSSISMMISRRSESIIPARKVLCVLSVYRGAYIIPSFLIFRVIKRVLSQPVDAESQNCTVRKVAGTC